MTNIIRLVAPIISPFLIAAAFFGLARCTSLTRSSAGPQLISFDPAPKFTCSAHQGETVTALFTIKNIADDQIRVLGATTSCSCTVADGLPLTLNRGDSGKVRLFVNVGAPDSTGKFTTSTILMTNHDGIVPPLFTEVTVLDPTFQHQ